jgi:hypothetical protein
MGCVKFQVLTSVIIKITVLWDMTQCSLVDGYQRLGNTLRFLIPVYQTTRCHILNAAMLTMTCADVITRNILFTNYAISI